MDLYRPYKEYVYMRGNQSANSYIAAKMNTNYISQFGDMSMICDLI